MNIIANGKLLKMEIYDADGGDTSAVCLLVRMARDEEACSEDRITLFFKDYATLRDHLRMAMGEYEGERLAASFG
jgi:hypothetical protein